MNQGIYFTNQGTGESGWLLPVGWTPEIVPKVKPLTDLSGARERWP